MPGGPFFNCYPGPFSNVRCKGYSPGLHHETSVIKAVKESSSITDARSALDGFFNHLKVDFIKDSL